MNTENLTYGNIKYQLIGLTLPLILSNILQELYNTIDTYMVGSFINDNAIASIGISGSIMNLFIFIIIGANNGISLILARYYGEKNYKKFRKSIFTSIIIGGGITVILSITSILILNFILNIINTPMELKSYVTEYLNIILIGLISCFLYNLCSSLLRSVGNSKTSLYILLLSTIANIIMDYIFIKIFGLGIQGAAIATVLSQIFSAVIAVIYINKKYPYLICKRADFKLDIKNIKSILDYMTMSSLHQSSLYIGKLLIQGAVNALGTNSIIAFTASSRIEAFPNSFAESGGTAISIFISQNKGAEKNGRIKKGFKTGLKLMLLMGMIIISIAFILSKPLSGMFIENNINAVNEAASYLKVISIFYIFCFIGSSFVGYYKGVGMMNIPVVGTILHISIRTILSYILIYKLSLSAVAVSTGLGWIAVNIMQMIIFFKRNSDIKKDAY